MTVALRTVSQTDSGTYGMLIRGEETLCRTCEDAWEDNAPNVSCIPAGAYQVVARVSPKYGKHWHVLDVPNRSLILIHVGNFPSDSTGCVLVGEDFMRDKRMRIVGVTNSKATMARLRETLPAEFTLVVER